MARKVKCAYTNEYGTSDVFYKAEDGKYYQSEEIYQECKFEKKCRMLLLDKFVDILGYNNTSQFPTILSKEIKELHVNFNYSVILKTFNKCFNNIKYSLENKRFASEFGKIKYIFAIIKNKINEVNINEKNIKAYSRTQDINIEIINNKTTNTRRHKDITEFLGDDE